MLRFCTAAPLAPLPKLSKRAEMTQVRICARKVVDGGRRW